MGRSKRKPRRHDGGAKPRARAGPPPSTVSSGPLPPLTPEVWALLPAGIRAAIPLEERPRPLGGRRVQQVAGIRVTPRHDPGDVAAELAAAQSSLRGLLPVLGRGNTYFVDRELQAVTTQVHDVASRFAGLDTRFVTGRRWFGGRRPGPCAEVAHALDQLADGMLQLGGREPFYVRVRDADLTAGRGAVVEAANRIAAVADAITVG